MSILEILEAHQLNSRHLLCACGDDVSPIDGADWLMDEVYSLHRAHVAQVLEQHEREREAAALEEAAESLNPELINYRRDAMEVLSQRIQPAGGNDTLSLQLALVAAKRSREWLHNRAAQLKESP